MHVLLIQYVCALSYVWFCVYIIYDCSRNRLFWLWTGDDWCPGLVTLRRELSRRLCLQGSTRSHHRLQEKCDWLPMWLLPKFTIFETYQAS